MCELIEKSPMQKCRKTFVHDYRRRWTKLGKNGQMDTQNSQKTANQSVGVYIGLQKYKDMYDFIKSQLIILKKKTASQNLEAANHE